MKKGTKIIKVEIIDSTMKAYTMDKHGEVSKLDLSRKQRDIFGRYKSPSFVDNVRAEFNADVLDEHFIIEKNGKQVYPPKKDDNG